MKRIRLSQGKIAFVDDEDFEKVNEFKWNVAISGKKHKIFYAARGFWNGSKQITKLMHRFILDVPDGMVIDHIDGDGLNNQKSNLRIVTNRENCGNWHVEKRNRYKHVYWNKRKKRWYVEFYIDGLGKRLRFGLYRNEDDAVRRRDEELIKLGLNLGRAESEAV